MKTTTNIEAEIAQAESLDHLLSLLRQRGEEWYEAVGGCYAGNVPTWGPETEQVRRLINSSGPEGDIVSWDTRGEVHRYLMRGTDCERNYWRIDDREVR